MTIKRNKMKKVSIDTKEVGKTILVTAISIAVASVFSIIQKSVTKKATSFIK